MQIIRNRYFPVDIAPTRKAIESDQIMVDKRVHFAISLALVPFGVSLRCVVCFDAFDNFLTVQRLVPIWGIHLHEY